MHQHSLNRVKKNINDFIMRDYRQLFILAVDDAVISRNSFLQCERLLQRAKDEIRNSVDPNKNPEDLVKECILELMTKGFLVE